jgi:hypothetical protein
MCRFELPTDDAAFELRRTQRMAQRRPRYALDDLRAMRVAELNRLCDGVGIDRTTCLTKRDLVTCVATSGRIELLGGAARSEDGSGGRSASAAGAAASGGDETHAQLMGERVGALRTRAAAANVSLDGCVEKRDIVDRILGRSPP